MLESLHITNYALIDSIDIHFSDGLNVITGETGAGKSIILGALGLLFGARIDSKAVGNPERKSVIEATFTLEGDADTLQKLCKANDIDLDEENNTILLRREITPQGRSRAFINDTPVTSTKLKEFAIHLVDIHSQHRNLLLAQPEFQLDIIDSLAHNSNLLESYREHYSHLRDAIKKLKRTKLAIEKYREDEEFTRFQLEQLEQLDLEPGEQEELERERSVQANITEIKSNLSLACGSLNGSELSAIGLVTRAQGACESLVESGALDDSILSRLENIRIELLDLSDTITAVDDNLYAEADILEKIDSRLEALYSMQRKHHAESIDDLIELRNRLQARLSFLETADDEVARLEKDARKHLALAREAATKLTESRKAEAKKLAEELQRRAEPLGMKNLVCEIRVSPYDLTSTGADEVEFLFAFNKNQELTTLGKTASGGEISRLMLSVKAIIAESMNLPSMILDEIDTGVSGDVANRMGQMMLQISGSSQVITITHLPQVAAKGATHFKVFKEDDEQSTHTHIKLLTPDERVDEIALMLSGDASNDAARATAATLLNND